MSSDPFRPIRDGKEPTLRVATTEWVPIIPIPVDAPAPPSFHFQHGKPSAVYDYRNETGQLLGQICRFDHVNGEKSFYPLTFCKKSSSSIREWRWKSWPIPRPLYQLDLLTNKPDAPVIVTEGEKAADAVQALLEDFVSTTSPNGSKGAFNADWSALVDRDVTIWPDNDENGLKYASDVVEILRCVGAKSIDIIAPPLDAGDKWDAADALTEGWTSGEARKLVETASPLQISNKQSTSSASSPAAYDETKEGRRRQSQSTQLLNSIGDIELWHNPERTAFATVPVDRHLENMEISSKGFERWVSGEYYKNNGGVVGDQVLREVARTLEAKAINDGACHETCLRTGWKDGDIWIDLGNAEWEAVHVGPNGWEVETAAPVKFLRSSHMRALPAPKAGELLEDKLLPFVNVDNNDDFILIVGWLMSGLFPTGPYPILSLSGEQGSSKSTLARLLRTLVDPNAAPNRSMPQDERDLIVAAHNSWVISWDNLSGISNKLSDALCRLSTGGGFSTRALHTNSEEIVFNQQRPIILNGIPELLGRPDLADRTLTVCLNAIPEDQRVSEEEFWANFHDAWPYIFAALLDALSCALRNLPDVQLDKLPRMADFAKRLTAAEPGLGLETGRFMDAYNDNRKGAVEAGFESDPVARAIRDHVTFEWNGTPTSLLEFLNCKVSEETRKSRIWPKQPQNLGTAVRRCAGLLRKNGFTVDWGRSGERHFHISPPSKENAQEISF